MRPEYRALQRLGELAARLLLAVGHEVGDGGGHLASLTANMRMKAALARDDAAVGIGGGDAERRRLEQRA